MKLIRDTIICVNRWNDDVSRRKVVKNGMAFLDNLQVLMQAKGISRRKLAADCGISPSAVNSWFNRSAENISLQTLKKLSEYFGISIEELVYGAKPRHELVFTSDTYTSEELAQIEQFARFLIGQRERT